MQHEKLNQTIRTLVEAEETKSPIISAYLNMTSRVDALLALHARAREIDSSIDPEYNADFQSALGRVEGALQSVSSSAQGIAVFAREGKDPLFIILEFQVPLETEMSVDTVPNIYRLVELKDTYDRYVVLISNEREARIIEVSLGAVTRQLWAERPELRKRIGREWTRQHYQNHRRDRNGQFVKEKVRIIERVMQAGGHSHLILAGHPRMTARIQAELPKHLRNRVIDLVPVAAGTSAKSVVESTLDSFVAEEQRQSHELVKVLEQELLSSSSLAVGGPEATREALENGHADALVIAGDYEQRFGPLYEKQSFVRLAERSGCVTEIVADGRRLRRLGGVGCLLRFPVQTQLTPMFSNTT